MGRIIALTGKSKNGEGNFTKPRVVYVNDDAISIQGASKTGKGTKITEKIQNESNTYGVYEKAVQIEAARNPSTTDPYVKNHVNMALAGAGTTQGAGTALSKYLNEALTIGAAATEAFVLPVATVGMVRVVINNDVAGDAAKVFPAVGGKIDDQAINTVYSIPANTRKHFVCLVAPNWVTAEDFGQP
jgi:hypothetical protein